LLSLQIGDTKNARDTTTALLSKEVNAIKSDLRTLASQVSGVPVRRPKTTRQSLELPCPQCGNLVKYEQKMKESGYKVITCQDCKSKLLSLYRNGAFVLNINAPQPVKAPCPICSNELSAKLELMPGKAEIVNCPNCNSEVRLVRAKNEVRARPISHTNVTAKASDIDLNDEILRQVEEALPPQPWPKGTTRDVAARLKLSNKIVTKATVELIRRGVFKVQMDGKLYEPISESISDAGTPNNSFNPTPR
jgi:DNA-directed RNA polymerase subunit RPC12/RpoP